MNKTKVVIIILMLSTSALLYTKSPTTTNASPHDSAASSGQTPYIPTVETFIITEEEIQSKMNSYGNLSYVRKADITVSVEGTYERLLYEESDRVRAGEIVAELSNVQLENHLAQAEAAVDSNKAGLALAQARYEEGRHQVEARLLSLERIGLEIEQKARELEELERVKQNQSELFQVGGITESTFRATNLSYLSAKSGLELLMTDRKRLQIGLRDQDIADRGLSIPEDEDMRLTVLADLNTRTLRAELEAARARLESAKTELKSAQAIIDELTLTSPISGFIGQRKPEVGEKASPGDKVYTIFESGDVHVVFPVQESEAITISRGMETRVTIDSLPNEEFTALINRISPVVDPQSGNVVMRALIAGTDIPLKPGMFARVSVKTGAPRRAFLIPISAFFDRKGDEGSIYTIKNSRAFKKTLNLGGQYEDKMEVSGDLVSGELIIDNPSPILQDGQEVMIDE